MLPAGTSAAARLMLMLHGHFSGEPCPGFRALVYGALVYGALVYWALVYWALAGVYAAGTETG
jgi:hypothetical protein